MATRKRAQKKARRNHKKDFIQSQRLKEASDENFETELDMDDIGNESDMRNFNMKRPFGLRPNHIKFYDAALHHKTNMVLVNGSAGTAKTYLAVRAALEMFKDYEINNIVYIRSIIESASRSLGSLPGELDDKFQPYIAPLKEKVAEITNSNAADFLMSQGRIQGLPVNFARGMTFRDSVVIIDEAQNMTKSELVTLLTRFGKNTKYIVCGDTKQSDISSSGWAEIFEKFNNLECTDHGIHAIEFGPREIVRSNILKYIVNILEA